MDRNEQIKAVILSAFINYGDPDSRVDELSHDFLADGEPSVSREERETAYFAAMSDWQDQKRA